METIKISLLHNVGEQIKMGTSHNPFYYTLERSFLLKHFPYGDPVYLYSVYSGNMDIDDTTMYLETIYSDAVLKEIYKNHDNMVETGTLFAYGDNYIKLNISPDNKQSQRLLHILDKNKVFATFIYKYDKGEIIGIDKVALCLGIMNGYILFI